MSKTPEHRAPGASDGVPPTPSARVAPPSSAPPPLDPAVWFPAAREAAARAAAARQAAGAVAAAPAPPAVAPHPVAAVDPSPPSAPVVRPPKYATPPKPDLSSPCFRGSVLTGASNAVIRRTDEEQEALQRELAASDAAALRAGRAERRAADSMPDLPPEVSDLLTESFRPVLEQVVKLAKGEGGDYLKDSDVVAAQKVLLEVWTRTGLLPKRQAAPAKPASPSAPSSSSAPDAEPASPSTSAPPAAPGRLRLSSCITSVRTPPVREDAPVVPLRVVSNGAPKE